MKNLFLLLLPVLFIACDAPGDEQKQVTRPNIVWISAEDVSPRMQCYGDSTIPTPNIDRLAKEGILYRHAYTPAGVCAPTRHAIITGMYQISSGGHNMRTQGNTYPDQTGLPKEYDAVVPEGIKCFPEYLREAGYYTTNNVKTDYQFKAPLTAWDENSREATFRNRPEDKPFFAIFNFTTTHESQIWKRAENPMRTDIEKVVLPPYYPDNEISRMDVARHYSNISELDDQVGEIVAQLEEDGLMDNTIIFFWGDHGDGLPFFKREVYKRGLHIPLIVRFPDAYKAGTENNDLVNAIDFGPTVLSLAGVEIPKHMQGKAFLGEQKGEPRKYIFGARDRIDSQYDRVRSVLNKKYQFVKNFQPEKPLYMNIAYRKQIPTMQMILSKRENGELEGDQLFWFQETKAPEEFYDLEKDPFQLNNLIGEPSLQETISEMRTALDQWLEEVGDLGAIPEKELVAQWWQGKAQAPETAPIEMSINESIVALSTNTNGASIGYRFANSGPWQVYTQPFSLPAAADTIHLYAQRIGYQAFFNSVPL